MRRFTTVSLGLGDEIAPPAGILALYNALDTKKQITIEQNGRHNQDGGPYHRTYQVQGDPVSFDLEEIAIPDNGTPCRNPEKYQIG